jgi:hypothetical protein
MTDTTQKGYEAMKALAAELMLEKAELQNALAKAEAEPKACRLVDHAVIKGQAEDIARLNGIIASVASSIASSPAKLVDEAKLVGEALTRLDRQDAEIKQLRDELACAECEPPAYPGNDCVSELANAHNEIERLTGELTLWQNRAEGRAQALQRVTDEWSAQFKEIERLRERDAQWALDVLRLTESLRYLIGIAERGFGRKITDAETDRAFVLSYVQGLEAEIERLAKHSASRTVQVGELRDLLKECRKVMRANSVFRSTAAHKDLDHRIGKALSSKRLGQ